MIDYIKKAITYISKEINSHNKSNMYLLYGDEGIGKSTIAHKFPEVQKNTLSFKCGNELSLASQITKINPQKDYERHIHLYKPLIKKIKKEGIRTIIFDVESNVNEDFFDLISDVFDIINQQDHSLNIVIMLDNAIYHHYQKKFAKYQSLNYLPPLKKWENYDFFQLWEECYGEITFKAEILELIISYSIGNANVFLQHLNIMKYYNILYFKDGKWFFKPRINLEEVLKEEYFDVVRKKYEALSLELQTVIKQTSTIGYIFKKNTLKEVFDIQNARAVLKQIELLTELLYFTDSEMENGKFDSEAVQLQIEKMIDSKKLIIWCKALAEYYESKIKDTSFISIERCILKEKCIFYYTKAQIIDKIIFHYLSIIPLKCNLNQFNSAIEMSLKLADITQIHPQYNQIYIYCFYMLTIINKSLTNYNEALNNLNKYISLVEVETTEIKALKAELLYDVGETTKAYNTLKTLYKNICQIDDPYFKISIISMISSIEETSNSNQYIKHFNKAISIAKEYKLKKEYYQLLRKANMAHSGENGIMLMKAAESYFSDNNIISELVMVQHNIGTEGLFYEATYKSAYGKLNLAYKNAKEIGFSQLSYIKNSLALYYILDGNYNKSIRILNHILGFQQEDFTLLACLLNKATCLRKMQLYSEASECLDKAKKINQRTRNHFPFFTSQIIVQLAYLSIETGKYNDAYTMLRKYFMLNYNDRVTNIVSVKLALKKLCDMQKFKYSLKITDFSCSCDYISKKMAENYLVLCEIMFWE